MTVGYNKPAVLSVSSTSCRLWIASKREYTCDLLKAPSGRASSAEREMLRAVRGNGRVLQLGSGRLLEVSFQSYETALWLPGSELLILDSSQVVNLSGSSEIVDVISR